MTLIEAVVLGAIQGATEFIPVSSSGHLVLVPWLLGWESPGLTFDAMAHWGTLVAVLVYFRQDLIEIASQMGRDLRAGTPLADPLSRLGWMIGLATIPAVVAGLTLKSQFEALFERPIWVAFFLLVTGCMLWFAERLGSRRREAESVRVPDALLIGVAQALAITPGISRSGATISMGLLRDLNRPAAARFSFLMMIPVVLGAGLLQLVDLAAGGGAPVGLGGMAAGFATAALTGYLCIAFLLRYLQRGSVRIFALYCWLFGGFCLTVALLR